MTEETSTPEAIYSVSPKDEMIVKASVASAARASDSVVIKAIEEARKQLLDLSMRNKLLNYRPARTAGIEVVDEDPDQVYQVLVIEQKAMVFVGIPVSNEEQLSGSYQSPVNGIELAEDGLPKLKRLPVDTSDLKLNTLLAEDKLHIRSLKITTDARTSLEEQGINTLFLALGMLVWAEKDGSHSEHKAPLVLVPVTFERSGAEKFRLRYSGEEIVTNLSLQAKLKLDFRLELPEFDNPEETLPSVYFEKVASVIAEKPAWKIERSEITLGFFSHAKYLMYKDLDTATWSAVSPLGSHPVLANLLGLGFDSGRSTISEDDSLDLRRPVSVSHEVLDADSSQLAAVSDAMAGVSMVIEGPPGTGKSQTICNLIAEAVANSKRVLFVSEKMAALNVVKKYLDRVGLGDPCLELHSHKAKKKDVLEELRRVLELGKPQIKNVNLIDRLTDYRTKLNEYVEQLHTPIKHFKVTPREAIARLARTAGGETGNRDTGFAPLAGFTPAEFDRILTEVKSLERLIEDKGCPFRNEFYGSNPEGLMRSDLPELEQLLTELLTTTRKVIDSSESLASELFERSFNNLAAVENLLSLSDFMSSAPFGLMNVNLSSSNWIGRQRDLSEALEAGKKRAELHSRNKNVLLPDAWKADAPGIRAILVENRGKLSRFVKPSYHQALSQLKSLCVGKPPRSDEERIALLSTIEEAARLEKTVETAGSVCSEVFCADWRGTETRWDIVIPVFKWYTELIARNRAGRLSDELRSYIQHSKSNPTFEDRSSLLRDHIDGHKAIWKELLDQLQPDETAVWSDPRRLSFDEQVKLLETWIARPERLLDLQAILDRCKPLLEMDLNKLVDVAMTWDKAGKHLADSFEATYYRGILRTALKDRQSLRSFNGAVHEGTIEEFRKLDKELLFLNRARVALAHWNGLPKAGGTGQKGILLHEINKKKRHLPIRKLMESCPEPIQQIKPVFLMSPFSVAMFLPPNGPKFDLLIFDEASQVKPEDALGAILRSKQSIVVGDSQQMPPTSFFEKLTTDADDDNEDNDGTVSRADDMESILKLFRAQGAHYRHLIWHYRSRHHSLIAVSNHEFYDDKLAIFPHPEMNTSNLGLTMCYMPNTSYARGASRTNLEEAKAVVDEVLQHARETPQLTLGVAALSMAQQEAIMRQLEQQRTLHHEFVEFERKHPEEPFFVKNLENVQGDERDVIMISVGYGRTTEGYISHSFGPINNEGGERRLNVLISRARRKCKVFCNFRSCDIDLARAPSRGVRILKSFLSYAETGILESCPTPGSRSTESDFEESVRGELVKAGYDVHCQIGTAGFFIDLAVVDPERPGRYLLGIECDGVMYHSARSARDRDRLRQEVLENKGWRIHRIWGTDWLEHREREIDRLIKAIEHAKNDPDEDRTSEVEPAEQSAGTGIIRSEGIPLTDSGPYTKKPSSSNPDVLYEPIEPSDYTSRRESPPIRRRRPRSPDHVQSEQSEEAESGRRIRVLNTEVFAHKYQCVSFGQILPRNTMDLTEIYSQRSLLTECVKMTVESESPVHIDEVARRIREESKGGRLGANMRNTLEWAINILEKRGLLRREGNFLWARSMTTPTIRTRESFPPLAKKMEYIAPEEIGTAVREVVASCNGAPIDEVTAEVLSLLGFSRFTGDLTAAVAAVAKSLVASGMLREKNGRLEPVERKEA